MRFHTRAVYPPATKYTGVRPPPLCGPPPQSDPSVEFLRSCPPKASGVFTGRRKPSRDYCGPEEKPIGRGAVRAWEREQSFPVMRLEKEKYTETDQTEKTLAHVSTPTPDVVIRGGQVSTLPSWVL